MAVCPDREVALETDRPGNPAVGIGFFFLVLAATASLCIQHQIWTHPWWLWLPAIIEALALCGLTVELAIARRRKAIR